MNVSAWISVSLDGVMQAPARTDEDRRGGFEHGGWGQPYADAVSGARAGRSTSEADDGALLFGRRTYEDLYSVWPRRTDGNVFTEVLNRRRKYVASGPSRSHCHGPTRRCSRAMPRKRSPTSRPGPVGACWCSVAASSCGR
jgi:dihydrofolate reductase